MFLFDEPLANLDAALRAELRVELSSLVRRLGTTAIYVTHDQAEAMTMGDRIAVMKEGRLQQVAAPRAVYEAPDNLFVAGFLGAPPMNRVEVVREGKVLVGGGLRVAGPAEVESVARVTLGVRPEHVRVLWGGESGSGESGSREAGSVVVRAVMRETEPLGAETNVRLEAEGVGWWARVPGFDGPPRGAEVEMAVEERRILWFDGGRGGGSGCGEGAA
ncbi:MAG: ABC transporter ATP-binding protein [Polyangiaceae bacterium]